MAREHIHCYARYIYFLMRNKTVTLKTCLATTKLFQSFLSSQPPRTVADLVGHEDHRTWPAVPPRQLSIPHISLKVHQGPKPPEVAQLVVAARGLQEAVVGHRVVHPPHSRGGHFCENIIELVIEVVPTKYSEDGI